MLTDREEIELLELLEAEYKDKASNDYTSYVQYTNKNFISLPHSSLLAHEINTMIANRDLMLSGHLEKSNQYLMVSMPPRHGKSMTISETLPSYFCAREDKAKVIMTAYSIDLANAFAKSNATKMIENNVFGVSVDSNNQQFTTLSNGSVIRKAGILGGITGFGAHLMIIDDPIKTSEEANSQTTRDKIWNEWVSSLSTRLEPPAIVILVMTRWHEDDLAGRLLNPEFGDPLPWKVINLPLEAEENDVLGRKVGEPLWPDRYGYDFIKMRKQYPRDFSALYQGRPTSAEGNLVKREWFENPSNWYNRTDDVIKSMAGIHLSVDATFKDTEKSDKVAIHIWGRKGIDFYLIDVMTGRYDFLTTLQAIKTMHKRYKIGFTFIEDKANGSAIINTLRREIRGVVGVNPLGGKEARLQSVLPYLAGGNVKVPKEPFTNDVLEEWYAFPTGAHDDNVDAMTQAISKIVYYNRLEKKKVADNSKDYASVMTRW